MDLATVIDRKINGDQRGARYRLVKRPEQDELRPISEPLATEDPLLPRGKPVVAGDHAQLK